MDADARGRIVGVASMTTISADFIDAFPNLEIIANFGVGYDAVDAAHAASRGVMVTNTPDVLSDEVADTTVALLLNTLREFPKAEAYLRAGRWEKEGAYPLTPLTLRGRTWAFSVSGGSVLQSRGGSGRSVLRFIITRATSVTMSLIPGMRR
jgi:lactate dehydrogenase-like 2-hydroxyacid dehydrogenase